MTGAVLQYYKLNRPSYPATIRIGMMELEDLLKIILRALQFFEEPWLTFFARGPPTPYNPYPPLVRSGVTLSTHLALISLTTASAVAPLPAPLVTPPPSEGPPRSLTRTAAPREASSSAYSRPRPGGGRKSFFSTEIAQQSYGLSLSA